MVSVIVITVEVRGKYMIIEYLDPWYGIVSSLGVIALLPLSLGLIFLSTIV